MANASFRSAFQNTADNEFDLEIDETQGGPHSGDPGGAHQSPILVLSRYSALIDTVRKAAPRGVPVVQAPDLDHAAEKMPSLKPGVLVADTASTSDIAAMVAQLTQHFPELVVVVAGQREDSAALMQLTASGQIFRFLLVPLSHGQTRLTLEAAIAQHMELSAASQRMDARSASDEGEKKSYVTGYVAFALGLAVSLGGVWWFVSRMASEPEAPVATVSPTSAPPASTIASRPDPLKAEIEMAQEAFAKGKFVDPVGESALDYYRSALNIDPKSVEAQEGIRNVANKVLERAESALIAEKIEDAVKAIETARDIDPKHPRLAFLDAQVARERERIKLSQAQDLSRKIDGLVARARTLTNQDRLLSPSGASARDALLEARRIDPTNPEVAQGFRDLAEALGDEATRQIKAGNLDSAQSLVNSARQLGSAGNTLASVERALIDAKNAASGARQPRSSAPAVARNTAPAPAANPANDAANEMVAGIRRMLTEGKLIDPKGDNARDALAALRVMDPGRSEIGDLANTLSTRLLESGKQALAAKAFDRSQQLATAARDVGVRANEAAIDQLIRDLTQARTNTAGGSGSLVSAATLRRTKTVEPVYPAGARRRNEEGWVEVSFTVTPVGDVEKVEVRNANPASVFDEAAMKAVEQWRFEPIKVNGQPVSQRAIVRLRFSLD